MATGIGSYSKTAASNSTASAEIALSDSMAPDAVDNTQRQIMADIAEWRDDTGGALATSGTDTYTVTTNGSISSLAAGARLCVMIGTTNTGASTLNPDSLGAKAIRKIVGGADVALAAGDLEAGRAYDLVYVTALNSAAGGWLILGYAFPAVSTSGKALVYDGTNVTWGYPSGQTVLLTSTGAATGQSAFTLNGLDLSGYSRLIAVVAGLYPATDGSLVCVRISQSSTVRSDSTYNGHLSISGSDASTYLGTAQSGVTLAVISGTCSNNSAYGWQGVVEVSLGAGNPSIAIRGGYLQNTTSARRMAVGNFFYSGNTGIPDGVSFVANSGNISLITGIYVYGIRSS